MEFCIFYKIIKSCLIEIFSLSEKYIKYCTNNIRSTFHFYRYRIIIIIPLFHYFN